MHAGRKPVWAAFCALVLLFALMLVSGRPARQKVWANPQLEWSGGKVYTAGDGYGVKSAGPYLELAAGTYRLKWRIDGDGERAIRLSSSNDARIEPPVIRLPGGQSEGEAKFTLLDPAHSFSMGIEFVSGEQMAFHDLRLYSPLYTDYAWMALFLMGAVWLVWLLRRGGWLTRERAGVLVVLCAAALIACAPSLREDSTGGWDVQFHAARIMNLADALRAGQFPARVGGFSYNGYGAATSVFYPDAFLYPAALMVQMGASMSFALTAVVAAVSFLTAFSMAASARRMGCSAEGAAAAGALYVLCGYRIQDAYGGSLLLGEMIGMAFVPLFFCAMHDVLAGDERRWLRLALSAFALLESHLLTTALGAFAAILLACSYAPALLRERARLLALVKALLLALALGLHRLVPLADLLHAGVNTQVMQFGLAGSALEPYALFAQEGRVGLGLLAAAAACAYALTRGRAPGRGFALRLLALGCICALAATTLFPWNYAVRLAGGAVQVLQFPWRFLLLTAACFAMCGGWAFDRLMVNRAGALCLTLAFAALAVAPALRDVTGGARGVPFGEGANPYMVYPEYQIEGTDVNDTRSRQPLALGGVSLSGYQKDGTKVRCSVKADADGEAVLPMFGFPGYEVRLNGARIDWRLGGNNRLAVPLAAGAEGEMTVRWRQPALWRACDLVSLMAAAGACCFALRRRKAGKEVPLA